MNMAEEASLKFRLRKTDETRNNLLAEIKHNDLMSENYKNTRKYLYYVENLLILFWTVTGCVSSSAFASLVCVPVGITSSAVGTEICAITAGIRKYKSVIKKKKKKHDKILVLGKDKLKTIKVLISKALIDSYISHDEFIPVNDVFREYYEMKKRCKKSWIFCGIHYIKVMETYCVSCKKYTADKNSSVKKTKQNSLMLLSNCAVCGKKKSTFTKNKELLND